MRKIPNACVIFSTVLLVALNAEIQTCRAESERAAFRPLTKRDLETARHQLLASVGQLQAHADDEKTAAALHRLRLLASEPTVDWAPDGIPPLVAIQELTPFLPMFEPALPGSNGSHAGDQVWEGITRYLTVLRDFRDPQFQREFRIRLDDLDAINRSASTGLTVESRRRRAQHLHWMKKHRQPLPEVDDSRGSWPNLIVDVPRSVVLTASHTPIDEPTTIATFLRGMPVFGHGHAAGSVQLVPAPSADRAAFDLILRARVVARTRSTKGPATVHSASTTDLSAWKRVELDGNGLSFGPTQSRAAARVRTTGIQARGRGCIANLIRRVAGKRAQQIAPESRALAEQETRANVIPEFESTVSLIAQQSNRDLSKAWQELLPVGISSKQVCFSTSSEGMRVELEQDAGLGLAAPDSPKLVTSPTNVTVAVHESLVNNLSEHFLPHRQFDPEELLSSSDAANEDSEIDFDRTTKTIIMAHDRPLSVEFDRNLVRVAADGYWISGATETFLRVICSYEVQVVVGRLALIQNGDVVVTPVLNFSAPFRELSFPEEMASEAIRQSFPDSVVVDLPKMPAELTFLGEPTVSAVHVTQGWMYVSFALER